MTNEAEDGARPQPTITDEDKRALRQAMWDVGDDNAELVMGPGVLTRHHGALLAIARQREGFAQLAAKAARKAVLEVVRAEAEEDPWSPAESPERWLKHTANYVKKRVPELFGKASA